jgi:hypothetical protein
MLRSAIFFREKSLGKALRMRKFPPIMFEPIKAQLDGVAEKMGRLRRFL